MENQERIKNITKIIRYTRLLAEVYDAHRILSEDKADAKALEEISSILMEMLKKKL